MRGNLAKLQHIPIAEARVSFLDGAYDPDQAEENRHYVSRKCLHDAAVSQGQSPWKSARRGSGRQGALRSFPDHFPGGDNFVIQINNIVNF
ncbi:hypothetical protein JCM14635_10610 [Megalodesulfovibrio paquesii]